jgi:hypothetical protein
MSTIVEEFYKCMQIEINTGRKAGRGEGRWWVLQWNKDKLELGNVTWKPEKVHLTPEVREANAMVCDYVWDKLYRPPFL